MYLPKLLALAATLRRSHDRCSMWEARAAGKNLFVAAVGAVAAGIAKPERLWTAFALASSKEDLSDCSRSHLGSADIGSDQTSAPGPRVHALRCDTLCRRKSDDVNAGRRQRVKSRALQICEPA